MSQPERPIGANEPAPTPAGGWPVRRALIVAFLLLAIALAAYLAWKRWRAERMPPPPSAELDGLDPTLRQAILAARERVVQQPRSAEAWGHLGKLLRGPDFNSQASFCFAQAEKLEPNKIIWTYLRGEAFILQDPETAVVHLSRAAELADRVEPDNITARLRLAETLLTLGRFDEADSQLHRALEIDPDNINVRFNLGLLAIARANLEEGRQLLLRCQYSEFTRQKACLRLAAVCERLGRAEDAARFQQKARELPKDFNWPDPYIMDYRQAAVGSQARLQYVDRLESQGKFGDAVEILQAVLADGPDYRAYVGLGKNLAQLGKFEEAEQAFDEAIKLAPENAKAHYYLGRLHLARGELLEKQHADKIQIEKEYQAAADSARKALARKPDDSMTHVALGLALVHLGKKPDAFDAFTQAVACNPEQPEPHFHLAEALLEKGERDKARTHLEQVIQLAKPDDSFRKKALELLRDEGPRK
jgi:cytochrome c-type biogenesis protein CcmH/NrfG